MTNQSPRKLLAAAVLLLAPLLVAAGGAEPRLPRNDLGPEPAGVHVNSDDDAINEVLEKADAAAATGDYAKAVTLYQEAAEQATDQVYRVARRTYLGVREYTKSRIRQWPEEGLALYRRIADPRAGEVYEEAIRRGDERGLSTVARTYPLSSYGARAMLALGTRALSRGDHDAALGRFLEILRLYPEGPIPGVRREDVIARAALSAAKQGDRTLLLEMRERARRQEPPGAVAVGGEEVPLVDYTSSLTQAAAGSDAPVGWNTVGATSARSGGRDGPKGPLVLYWAYEIPGSEEDTDEDARNSPVIPVHPLIVGREIIAAGHVAVTALELPPDDFVPTKAALDQLDVEPTWYFPQRPSIVDINSVTGQSPVFATAADGVLTLPFRDVDNSGPTVRFNDQIVNSTLVSLSLSGEGKLLEQRGGADPLFGKEYEDIIFSGAPAVAGDRVWVSGARTENLVETMVFCFERNGAAGGLEPVWRSSLCTAGKILQPLYRSAFDFEGNIDASSVALRHGVVYVCSNTGCVAALDAASGEVIWIHVYERAEQRPAIYTREAEHQRTWFPNPPILDHRLLYVAPLDADKLFIYFQKPALEGGFVEHARIGRDHVVNAFDPEYVLGARNGVVFLAGTARNQPPLFAVKSGPAWPASEGVKGDQRRIAWRAEIQENAPRGRGVLAGDSLYFPTAKGIYRVAVADGRVTRIVDPLHPRVRRLAGDRPVIGNLAVSGRWLVSASEELICLFGPPPGEEKEEPEKKE